MIVVVEDGAGAPIPSATVSFRLPDSPSAGTFQNGLRTEIATTGSDGRAASSAVRWPATGGPVAVRVTAAKGELRAGLIIQVEGTGSPSVPKPQIPPVASAPAAPPASPAPEAIVHKPVVLGAAVAPKPPTPLPADLQVPQYEPPSFWKSKWFLVAASAGGALAAGFFAARPRSSTPAVATVPVVPGGVTQLPVTIGPPTVIIGKP